MDDTKMKEIVEKYDNFIKDIIKEYGYVIQPVMQLRKIEADANADTNTEAIDNTENNQ